MNRQPFLVATALLILVAISHADGHSIMPTLHPSPLWFQGRLDPGELGRAPLGEDPAVARSFGGLVGTSALDLLMRPVGIAAGITGGRPEADPVSPDLTLPGASPGDLLFGTRNDHFPEGSGDDSHPEDPGLPGGIISEPTTYGLFVGVHHGEIRGDLDAASLRDMFVLSRNLIQPGNERLLTGDYEEGGISNARIEGTIKSLKSRMKPRETLIVYLSAHGFSKTHGDETSETRGDEYLAFSKGSHFTDDYLSSLLADMDEVEKWVMIDACRSGGFWTANRDEGGRDAGDLEHLKNISLFAPAGETEDSYADENGRGYFAAALMKAIESEGVLTFDVLEHSIRQSALADGLEERPAYLRSLGDIVDLPLETWAPVAFKSDDFEGTLGYRGVAEPTHGVFLSCGLAGLVALRRMFGRLLFNRLRKRKSLAAWEADGLGFGSASSGIP